MATRSVSPPDAVALRPDAELQLLLEWPQRHSPAGWLGIYAAAVVLNLLLASTAAVLPSGISARLPERRVILHRTPLYLPPDLLTQRAPNTAKPTERIDLASLLAARAAKAKPAAPRPSVRHFEAPPPPRLALNQQQPVILPPAPSVGLPSPTAPVPVTPNIAAEHPPAVAAPAPHTIAAPHASIQSAIQSLAQNAAGRNLRMSDESLAPPSPGSRGSAGQQQVEHAAVELQSDPQGADFRAYLAQILSIVRSNWRRVTPESVRMGTLHGRTVIEFAIDRDGSIPKLVVADPSGSDALDRASVAGISMSNPLPPLPADFKGFQVRLAFTFSYNVPQ